MAKIRTKPHQNNAAVAVDAAAITDDKRGARPVRNDGEVLEALADFIQRNPHVLGGGDILMITGGKPVARAGMLAAVLAGLSIDGGERAIQKYLIIVPPAADVASEEELAWSCFEGGCESLSGRPFEPQEVAWFQARFEVRNAPDGRTASLLKLMDDQPERTGVIVVEAATYRDDNVAPFVSDGAMTPLIAEDVWAPQLHALAGAAEATANKKILYVALDANELTPVRPKLEALLLSLEQFGVMGASDDVAAETIVAKRVNIWDQWIAAGHVGHALKDVAALPASLDSQKSFLRIQLLHKAGLHIETLAAIRLEFLSRDYMDPSTRVRLARIAEDAGASSLACELLEACIEKLESREDLEGAIGTLMSAAADTQAQRVVERLEVRFPGAEGSRRYRRVERLRARDFAAVADLWREEDLERADFYDTLNTALSGVGVPDYLGLIESAKGGSRADAYRFACADDALARGLTVHAFDLAAPRPAAPALIERWERHLLAALERCFLDTGPDGNPPIEISRMQDALRTLLAQLAEYPLNVTLRIGIEKLFRPNVAGTQGLALIAKLVLDIASTPVNIVKGFQFGDAGMEWLLEHKPFIDRAFGWLQNEQPILIGKLALPKDLLTEDPDVAISALASYLATAPVSDHIDINALKLYLTLAAAIAPHASDPDVDLRLYCLVAGKLVSGGFPQHGRDLAEAAIQAGVSSPRRRRLAWFVMADVYHRAQDHLTGLVALGCTFLADNSADEEEIWQEIYTTARYMRDIGLHEIALATVTKGRELLTSMGLLETHGNRLDLLEVQIRLIRLDSNDPAELQMLLDNMVHIGQEVLKYQDETAPSGIMLGQLIRESRRAGLEISQEAESVFAELTKWAGGNLQAMIDATAAAKPSIDHIAQIVGAIPETRYADDVGYDTNMVAILAERALTDDNLLAEPENVSFALEVLADWGTALPHWDERAAPPPVPNKAGPAAIARTLSEDNVAILQLGLDANGLLVRATTEGGVNCKATREPKEIFSRQAFHDWSREFPRRYGYDDSPNLFYTTTELLRLSTFPIAPTIIVASTELQSFPPNILFDGLEFIGRKQPVATAPSLAWLQGSYERNWTGDGRLVAWISTAEDDEGRATLSLLAQRLEEPFVKNGFSVNTGPVIPTDFAGSTMAVLTAHGGINPEGKYFQVVSDEGVLKVSAADLAAAVRNVSIVVWIQLIDATHCANFSAGV